MMKKDISQKCLDTDGLGFSHLKMCIEVLES